ncbi:TNF receptor-associated factor 5-like [Clytia hemisphaerica]|uniref:Uncharacterized protein n=1 Tax=Clytia hemisphaerica TaxID=252671 RepID=A0A7M5TZT7_9CNID
MAGIEKEEYELGYDFKTTGVLPKLYECAFCHQIIRRFTELPCGHGFCEKCLDKWEKKKQDENENAVLRCIVCNQVYPVDKKHFSMAFHRAITNDVDIFCKYKERGCLWTGSINDFEKHEKLNCQFTTIKCSFQQCNMTFWRKFQPNHEKICQYRPAHCDYCKNKDLRFVDLEAHHVVCDQFPSGCGNIGCQVILPREKMINSHSKECPFEFVPCKFHEIGCKITIMRSKQKEHDETFQSQHMDLLLHNTVQLKKELQCSQQELEKQKAHYEKQKGLNEKQKGLNEKMIHALQATNGVIDLTVARLFELLKKPHSLYTILEDTFQYDDFVCSYKYLTKEQRFSSLNHEDRIKTILLRMEIGEIYRINENVAIFKIQVLKEFKVFDCAIISRDFEVLQKEHERNNRLVFGSPSMYVAFTNSRFIIALKEQIFVGSPKLFVFHVKKEDEQKEISRGVSKVDWNGYKTDENYALFEIVTKAI